MTNNLTTLVAAQIGNLRGNVSAEDVLSLESLRKIIEDITARPEANIHSVDLMAEVAIRYWDLQQAKQREAEQAEKEQARSYWSDLLETITAE
jgi:Tfp pilus assembly protein PilN